jgi:hypothetical protein
MTLDEYQWQYDDDMRILLEGMEVEAEQELLANKKTA